MRSTGLALVFIFLSGFIHASELTHDAESTASLSYLNAARIFSGIKQALNPSAALDAVAQGRCQNMAKYFDLFEIGSSKNSAEMVNGRVMLVHRSNNKISDSVGYSALLNGYGSGQVQERIIVGVPNLEVAITTLMSSPYDREPFLAAGIHDFSAHSCRISSNKPEYNGQRLYVFLVGNYRSVLQQQLRRELCAKPDTDVCPLGPARCKNAIQCSPEKIAWQEWLPVFEMRLYQPQNEGVIIFPGHSLLSVYPVAKNLENNPETNRPWGSPITLRFLPDTLEKISLALPTDNWFDAKGQLRQNWSGGYVNGAPVMSPDVFLFNDQGRPIPLISMYKKEAVEPQEGGAWLPTLPLEWDHQYRLEVNYQQVDNQWVKKDFYFTTLTAGVNIVKVEQRQQLIRASRGQFITLVFPFMEFFPDELSGLELQGHPEKENAHVDFRGNLFILPDNRASVKVEDDYVLFNKDRTFLIYFEVK